MDLIKTVEIKVKCLEIAVAVNASDVKAFAIDLFEWVAKLA